MSTTTWAWEIFTILKYLIFLKNTRQYEYIRIFQGRRKNQFGILELLLVLMLKIYSAILQILRFQGYFYLTEYTYVHKLLDIDINVMNYVDNYKLQYSSRVAFWCV